MNADEIAVGMQVRYPRTGTAGTVTRIEQMKIGRASCRERVYLCV